MFIKSETLKNISTLSVGTVAAQIIPLVFAPVIAKLYSAEQFGYFAAILAIVNIFSVVINGKYEMSVILPTKEKDSNSIIFGSWGIGAFLSLIIFTLLTLSSGYIANKFRIDFGIIESLIVSIMLFSIAVWQPLNYFFIRKKSFKEMVFNKIVKSGSLTLVTILLGYLSWDYFSNGLVIGSLLGWFFLLFYSIYQARKNGFTWKGLDLETIKSQLIQYKDYPLFNAFPAVLNSIGSQMGVYIFTFYFTGEITGYYSFSKQYLFVPLTIVGISLSQVYFQRISEKFKAKESIIKELRYLLLFLFIIGVIVILVVQLFVVNGFILIFGNKWEPSAIMAKYLILYFVIQFIVSPLSTVLHALKEIKLASIFPFIYVTSMCLLVFAPKLSLSSFLPYYVLAEGIPYLLYLGIIIYAVNKYEKALVKNN